MISLFFLAIMAPGLFLNRIVGLFREKTKFYSLLCIAVGLALIWISPKEWVIAPGCILVGLGYGVIQPVIYDKTTHTAVPKKATLALQWVGRHFELRVHGLWGERRGISFPDVQFLPCVCQPPSGAL